MHTELLEGRPIVGGPSFFTSGLSEMIDIILKHILAFIPHILKDSFDLIRRIDSEEISDNTYLGSADIKALYTNRCHI